MTNAQKMEYGWFGWTSPYVEFYGTTTNATTGVVTTNQHWGASHPVGLLKPNPWGLYDMHGNIWETCLDYFVYDKDDWSWVANDYHDPVADPMGVASAANNYRVIRGGSYSNGAGDSDSSMRFYGNATNSHGIRLVCPALATR